MEESISNPKNDNKPNTSVSFESKDIVSNETISKNDSNGSLLSFESKLHLSSWGLPELVLRGGKENKIKWTAMASRNKEEIGYTSQAFQYKPFQYVKLKMPHTLPGYAPPLQQSSSNGGMYAENGIESMFPWQVECLSLPGVLDGANLVYSAPTSAGKTLVAEIILLKRVLESGKKGIFILPFVSITREKAFSLQKLFGVVGIRVDGFMGGQAPPGGFQRVDIAICTIEKANNLINRLIEEKKVEELGIIIVDELHMVGDSSRGYLLELLLTKLQFISCMNTGLSNKVQVVGMSATLPNLHVLANWLNAKLYCTNFRPVPLMEMVKIGTSIFNDKFAIVRELDADLKVHGDADNLVQLCLEMVLEGYSTLVFCPTKAWSEKISLLVASSFFSLGNENSTYSKHIIDGIRKRLDGNSLGRVIEALKNCPAGLDPVLAKSLAFGAAFHHAGLTFDERDIIEGAFRAGYLPVLIATSTLSSGVNLPARRVIIRSPNSGGKILDTLTYRQMVGRAGRKGKDTEGESILICLESEKHKAHTLVTSNLPPIMSCLYKDESLTSSMKRALLEVVASGAAKTADDINKYWNCTLLSATLEELKNNEATNSQNSQINHTSALDSCIEYLLDNELIRCHDKSGEKCFIPSQLGSAILASGLSPDEGLHVFSELQKARKCFVLENELHIVYQVTPPYVSNSWPNLDWMNFLEIWENLPADMKKVGELVGVEESFIIRSMNGTVNLKVTKQKKCLFIHYRFFAALALHDLVHEVSLSTVVKKYGAAKGLLQGLQQQASTFAGMVTIFCNRLGWHNLELLIHQYQHRLQFGIQRDLCDLVRLTLINGQRARILFNAGLETVGQVAHSVPITVENILINSSPFQSAKNNPAGGAFILGPTGSPLTIKQAAVDIVEEARKLVQKELNLEYIDWDQVEDKNATNINLGGLNVSKTKRRKRNSKKRSRSTSVGKRTSKSPRFNSFTSNNSYTDPCNVTSKEPQSSQSFRTTRSQSKKNMNDSNKDKSLDNLHVTNNSMSYCIDPRNLKQPQSLSTTRLQSNIKDSNKEKSFENQPVINNNQDIKVSDNTNKEKKMENFYATNNECFQVSQDNQFRYIDDIVLNNKPSTSGINNKPYTTSINNGSSMSSISNKKSPTSINNGSSMSSSSNKKSPTSINNIHEKGAPTTPKLLLFKNNSVEKVTSVEIANTEQSTSVDIANTEQSTINKSSCSKGTKGGKANFLFRKAKIKADFKDAKSVHVQDLHKNLGTQSVQLDDSKVNNEVNNLTNTIDKSEKGKKIPLNCSFNDSFDMFAAQVLNNSDLNIENYKTNNSNIENKENCLNKNNLSKNIDVENKENQSHLSDTLKAEWLKVMTDYEEIDTLKLRKQKRSALSDDIFNISNDFDRKESTPKHLALKDKTQEETPIYSALCEDLQRSPPESSTKSQRRITFLENPEEFQPRISPFRLNGSQPRVAHNRLDESKMIGQGVLREETHKTSNPTLGKIRTLNEYDDESKMEEYLPINDESPPRMFNENLQRSVSENETDEDILMTESGFLSLTRSNIEKDLNKFDATIENANDIVGANTTLSDSFLDKAFDSYFKDGHDMQSDKNFGHDIQSDKNFGHDIQSDKNFGHDIQLDKNFGHDIQLDKNFGHDIPSDKNFGRDIHSDKNIDTLDPKFNSFNDCSSLNITPGTEALLQEKAYNGCQSILVNEHKRLVNKPNQSPALTEFKKPVNKPTQSTFIIEQEKLSKNFTQSSLLNQVPKLGHSNISNSFENSKAKSKNESFDSELDSSKTNKIYSQLLEKSGNNTSLDSTRSLNIIDVANDSELFNVFLNEWQDQKVYSISLACEKSPPKPSKGGIGWKVCGRNRSRRSIQQQQIAGLVVENSELLLTGIAVCWGENDSYYINLKASQENSLSTTFPTPPLSGNVSLQRRIEAITQVFINSSEDAILRCWDVKKTLNILLRSGLGSVKSRLEDPRIASWMLDPTAKEKNIHNLVVNYCEEYTYLLDGIGSNFGVESLGICDKNQRSSRVRASTESVLVFHLSQNLGKVLVEMDMKHAWTEVEMPNVRVLAFMELTGIGFSSLHFEEQKKIMEEKLSMLEQEAFQLAGRPFSLNSPDETSKVLYRELHLPSPVDTDARKRVPALRKPRLINGPTNKEALEKLKDKHPLPSVILEWRRINFTLNKFVFPLMKQKLFCPVMKMDRIYSVCHLFTATGRVSMQEPNIQNIPKDFDILLPNTTADSKKLKIHFVPPIMRQLAPLLEGDSTDERKVSLRHALVAGSGRILLAADYSQLELRLLAHFSKDVNLLQCLNSDQDVFRNIASRINQIPEQNVTDELRQRAKQICYGIIYGMGEKSLSEALQLKEEEAVKFINDFKRRFSSIPTYIDDTVKDARDKGYVVTIKGRRRYLPALKSSSSHVKAQSERQAVNTRIQGSAADLVKMATVAIEKEIRKNFPQSSVTMLSPKGKLNGGYLVLQLHDELIYEVVDEDTIQVAQIVRDEMENVLKLTVKLPVKIKVGPSWGSMKLLSL